MSRPLPSQPPCHQHLVPADRPTHLAEFSDELPAHPARARRWHDVRRDRQRSEIAAPVPLRGRRAQCDALGAVPDGVRGVFDVGAGDVAAVDREQGATDAEVRVGACASLGSTRVHVGFWLGVGCMDVRRLEGARG